MNMIRRKKEIYLKNKQMEPLEMKNRMSEAKSSSDVYNYILDATEENL